MKKAFLSTLLVAALISCNNSNSLKERELELKQKELGIRERELQQKETEGKMINDSKKRKDVAQQSKPKSATRKLRYLYYSNGGLLGYFDDGTVAGCPRCDLIKENVKTLYSQIPHIKYTVENGSLLVDGTQREYPKEGATMAKGWAMINYRWLINL